MRLYRAILVAVLFLTAPLLCKADTIYTYTGNTFTTDATAGGTCSGCAITITLDFANAFAPNLSFGFVTPVSFQFAVGATTVNNTTPNWSLTTLEFATDNAGNISSWDISLQEVIGTTSNAAGIGSQDFVDGRGPHVADAYYNNLQRTESFVTNNPGTWTTPEPGSLLLLATGLVGGIGAMRRRLTK